MTALILKNFQNDFMSLGAVPIEGAEDMIPKANKAMGHHGVVIAIQKWLPADHHSFAANHPWRKPGQEITINDEEVTLQIMHCVAESFGAAFPNELRQEEINHIIKDEGKGGDVIMEEINKIIEQYQVASIEVLGPGLEVQS